MGSDRISDATRSQTGKLLPDTEDGGSLLEMERNRIVDASSDSKFGEALLKSLAL